MNELRRRLGRVVLAVVAAALVPACNHDDGDDGVANAKAVATVGTPVGVKTGNVTISYALSDAEGDVCSIVVEYSLNSGGTWTAATAGPGGDGTTGLAAAAGGTAHAFVWNSLADGAATAAANPAVRVRITPSDARTGTSGSTGAFTVDNSTNTAPSVLITTPGTPQSGHVTISYQLSDAESHACSILAQYSLDGVAFNAATAGPGGDGTIALVSSPGGTAHTFVWDSLLDGVGSGGPVNTVRFRITPTDTATGAAATTTDFVVNNSGNTAPSVSITPPGSVSGLVAVSYTLTDAESSTVSVLVEFSTNGGTSFAPAFQGPGGDATVGLTASGGGIAHTFVWNSFEDGVGTAAPNSAVRIRITPSDVLTGGAASTADFTVDNTAHASGGTVGAPYPINSNDFSILEGLATDGRHLYAAGHDFDAWRIEKIDPIAGTTVWGVSVDPTAGDDRVEQMVVSGPYLYLAGHEEIGPFGDATVERRWRIEKRLLATGALVPGFGTAGVLLYPNFGDTIRPTIAVDATHLYVTGPDLSGGGFDFRLEKRLKSDGSLVGGFGTNGVVTGAGGIALAVDATAIYSGGAQDLFTDAKLRIEKRSILDGTLVGGFGAGGVVIEDANAVVGAMELVTSVVLDGTHLYAFDNIETGVGTGAFTWRVQKRTLDTGAAVTAVAGSGTGYVGPGGGHLALSSGALYVTGRSGVSSTDGDWRFEKRSTAGLGLVSGFNGTGIVTFNPTVGTDDEGASMSAVTGGVLFVAGVDNGAPRRWRIEARFR